jgi:hypothetical protein
LGATPASANTGLEAAASAVEVSLRVNIHKLFDYKALIIPHSSDQSTNVGDHARDAVTAMGAFAATLRARVAAEEAGTTILETPSRADLRAEAYCYPLFSRRTEDRLPVIA